MVGKTPARGRDKKQEPSTTGSHTDERDDLTPEDWQRILQRTGALSGWSPREIADDIGVTLAPEPLFTLKPVKPVWRTARGSRRDSEQFQNHTEQKFLEAAFDKTAIETTIQATTPVGGLGVSGGFARSKGKSVSTTDSQQVISFYIYHEFPRATVDLSSSSLMPSQHFLDFIEASHNRYSGSIPPTTPQDLAELSSVLARFQYAFGTVFARQIWLGGRRNAIQRIYRRSNAVVSSSEEKTAIDASVAVPLTVASIKSGGARSWGSNTSNDSSGNVEIDVNSLVINGGEEAITEDVEAWQGTLKPPNNWKVIKQDNVTALLPFLLRVLENMKPEYEHIEFIRGIDGYAQELRAAQERERAAVSEPLALWISSLYSDAPKSGNVLSKLFKPKGKATWKVMLNTDKPETIDTVKIKAFKDYETGDCYADGFDGFPEAFPVEMALPIQRTVFTEKTMPNYDVEFIVELRPNFEWRKSEKQPSVAIERDQKPTVLRLRVLLDPKSKPITAECQIHTKF